MIDLAAGLPRPDIVRHLLATYFGSAADEQSASSHWRQYAKLFDVQAGPNGELLSLQGTAFGVSSWSGGAHRWFDELTITAHLRQLPRPERLQTFRTQMTAVVTRMGLAPTFDAFRQACTLETLDRYWQRSAPPRVVIIGDGYGILSGLIKDHWPGASITLIDLGRTLLFQAVHCQRSAPDARHVLVGDADAWRAGAMVYCPADRVSALAPLSFDLAINVASMQEMAPETVADYFAFLRRQLVPDNVFYCCNRERKVLPGGEVSELARYPWRSEDTVMLDELCPWHQYYLSWVPPFKHRYDGRHRHRVVTLQTEGKS